ncbi:D-glycero-beta-D-manno-heptose 1-phosphate adenylyltransferase [bacterium]|nr:MAG: D-glycero-beta-D-manno-heptose 1-phosphate adenylyltransferase [bacterium]
MIKGAVPLERVFEEIAPRRKAGEKIVFTNGCFDIIHPGHVTYLDKARSLGDILVVGLNSDASVKRQGKGPGRPIMNEGERAAVLSALRSVDYVVLFDEDTPLKLIEALLPDFLVKGGDWPVESIVGREAVEKAGGKVLSIPLVEGKSTTSIVERIARSLRAG